MFCSAELVKHFKALENNEAPAASHSYAIFLAAQERQGSVLSLPPSPQH